MDGKSCKPRDDPLLFDSSAINDFFKLELDNTALQPLQRSYICEVNNSAFIDDGPMIKNRKRGKKSFSVRLNIMF